MEIACSRAILFLEFLIDLLCIARRLRIHFDVWLAAHGKLRFAWYFHYLLHAKSKIGGGSREPLVMCRLLKGLTGMELG